MKNLKIKLGLFSLLAILATSVFVTSCEQDSIKPIQVGIDLSKQEIPEEVYERMELLVNEKPDYSLIPPEVEIPELDEETILKLKTGENIESRGCLPYNGPSYHPQIGLIWAFEYPVTWVWSYKYGDWIWLDNEAHLCCCWVMFHTHNPICGMSGWMIDNNESDGVLWKARSSGWKPFKPCERLNWVDPLPDANQMTSDYGARPAYGYHSGVDFGHSNGYDNTVGKSVRAVAAGTIAYSSQTNAGTVVINHGSYVTRYRHLNNLIAQGTYVNAGDAIGTVAPANVAGTSQPHLHFEYAHEVNPDLYAADAIQSDNLTDDPSYQICHIYSLGLENVDIDESNIHQTLFDYCAEYGVIRIGFPL